MCTSNYVAPTLQVSITTEPRLTSGIALAGTSLTMTCTVSPYTTGIETYHWSSSCTGNCFVRGASTPVLQRDVLRVDDSGRHTCTVTRGSSSRQSSLTLTVIGMYTHRYHKACHEYYTSWLWELYSSIYAVRKWSKIAFTGIDICIQFFLPVVSF